jgi:hypothetical protein
MERTDELKRYLGQLMNLSAQYVQVLSGLEGENPTLTGQAEGVVQEWLKACEKCTSLSSNLFG